MESVEQIDAPKEALAELRAAVTDLHYARTGDRRQLRGLDLLSETALDLATKRDLDEVLDSICSRARRLLDTDVAYLMLIDPIRGDTYIRTTDGVVSDEFREMRLPFGAGLAGVVAENEMPAYTSDYRSDRRFAHIRHIDHCVALEGLKAICGVPLPKLGSAIGVLMSGSRSVRQFDSAEVALFETLATHAAVAIENARLFERAQSRLQDLEESNRANRRAADLHERLAALAVEGASAAELTRAAQEIVGGELRLVEAGSGGSMAAPLEDCIAIEVAAGSHVLAQLLWSPPDSARVAAWEGLLRRSVSILAGQLASQRARLESNHRRRSDFLVSLLEDADPSNPALRREAENIGISPEEPHIVIAADLPDGHSRWISLRAQESAAEVGGCARLALNTLTVLVPGEEIEPVATRWERILVTEGARPNIGIGPPAHSLHEIRSSHQDALSALNLLRCLGRTGSTVRWDRLGLLPLVFARGRAGDVARFVDQVLGPVLAHDANRRKPTLLTTLEAYFLTGARLSAAARSLDIHINTLYQRMETLSKVLGEDWRDPDRSMQIQFALRARTLLEAEEQSLLRW